MIYVVKCDEYTDNNILCKIPLTLSQSLRQKPIYIYLSREYSYHTRIIYKVKLIIILCRYQTRVVDIVL